MTRLKYTYLATFFLVSTLAYNNCADNQFQPLSALGVTNSASSQCRTKIINAAKAQSLQENAEASESLNCLTAENYRCDFRRFIQS